MAAPDERVLLYRVITDTGIEPKKAKELYEDAIRDSRDVPDDPNIEEGFIGKGRRYAVKTGFYIDDRKNFKKTAKVFLIIQLGDGEHVLSIRPNIGRKTVKSRDIFDQIHGTGLKAKSLKLCKTQASVEKALRIWETEFNMADIPETEDYQFSCRGRHQETTVLVVR